MSTPSSGVGLSPGSDLVFVEQDPTAKKKKTGSRLSRIFKRSTSRAMPEKDSSEEPQTAAQKRRQQVYQAQKRHRDRHAEYVRNLEAEVARLQHLDAVVSSEKNAMAHQNNAMRDFLAKQSIDAQFDLMDVNASNPSDNDLSALGAAFIDYRFDPSIEQDRWFLDVPELSWTSTDVSSVATPLSQHTQDTPIPGDSWAALDFILAMEHPCRKHIHHGSINPAPEICGNAEFHGHALTATQAIFQSAVSPVKEARGNEELLRFNVGAGLDPKSAENWVLPHSEIDKLVDLAEMLEIDDEFVTPAQAYSAVRRTVPNEKFLRPTLEALKQPLGAITKCQGFGAGMDAILFWQHLDNVIGTLQTSRPELMA